METYTDKSAVVDNTYNTAIVITYTSVFDGGDVVCSSKGKYNTTNMVVWDIEMAENESDADNSDSLTDEYITLPDGTVLREADGIIFDYRADED
jgi:hypothetical protein